MPTSPSPPPRRPPQRQQQQQQAAAISPANTISPKKGKLQKKTVLEKPGSMSQELWQGLKPEKKKIFAYVGRIEETSAGTFPVDNYVECAKRKGEGAPCIVYKDSARAQYHSHGGFSCNRCCAASTSCSFQRESTAAAKPRKRKTKADLETENKELRSDNKRLKRHEKWLIRRLRKEREGSSNK